MALSIKERELKRIKNEVKNKTAENYRVKIFAKMILALSMFLIKEGGYSIARTIIKREFRKIGKEFAEEFSKTFGLQKNSVKNASKLLKIAATIFGLELDVAGNETIVRNCPLGREAIKLNRPILCDACLEFNNGILEEMLSKDYILDRTTWIFKGDEYCQFKPIKRV